VLVGEGVEAVGTRRDDLLPRPLVEGVIERLDVLLGEHLVHELVAHAASRIAGTRFALAEDREADPGLMQQGGHGAGGLLRPIVERAGATDPEQVLPVAAVADSRYHEVEALRPVRAGARWRTPWVALALEIAQHHARLGREAGLDQNLVPPHV